MKLWGGRFTKETNQLVHNFNASISYDQKFYKQDILGSIAHVTMLEKQGILTTSEKDAIVDGLQGILNDLESGALEITAEHEDIHSFVEANLIERIGDPGKKLHTGRSRNDQVALDMKLYTRDEIVEINDLLKELMVVIHRIMSENIDTFMPGFTHLQKAQPVTLAHHFGAYFEMFRRDRSRLRDIYDRMNYSARPGQLLLLDDGKLLAEVTAAGPDALVCTVLRGGVLQSRKSIAAPGLSVPMPTLTSEDLANLRIAASCGVTGVMLPFVRGKQDILALRQALAEAGAPQIRIFAKIENLAGVQALPEFLSLVDEVVIARGDLGNAMPLWELPRCQKQLSAACRAAGVPFMVVTQMLDSMCTRAVPTRAEVSDIYNAVLDGASSLMLTGETAAGQYPVQAMEFLVRTASTAL